MINRCNNPLNKQYINYGGRGIKVCDRWLNSFIDFLTDMGPRPFRHTIERKNNDGNYEPNNCKWATYLEQSKNRRIRKDSLQFRVKSVDKTDCIQAQG